METARPSKLRSPACFNIDLGLHVDPCRSLSGKEVLFGFKRMFFPAGGKTWRSIRTVAGREKSKRRCEEGGIRLKKREIVRERRASTGPREF
jgi:hypothetical protein